MSGKPHLLIIGGPNGSGKTTVALQYAAAAGIPYIGADAIAASISPDDPTSARVAAGRQFVAAFSEVIASNQSCVVESTLSGRLFCKHMLTARNAGFDITVVFVFVESVDTCVARVAERVRKGGHGVPEEDVRRRYIRSIRNFWAVYRDIADKWSVLYNGVGRVQDVSAGVRRDVTVRDVDLHASFMALVESFSV